MQSTGGGRVQYYIRVQVALLQRCNLSALEEGVIQADVWMEGTARAKPQGGGACSVHGRARRPVSGAEWSGERENRREEARATDHGGL